MKLYTEADLKKVISIYSEEYKTSTDEVLKELNLTPIELPSDEEIEESSLKWFMTANKHEIIFDLGWMKIFEAGAKYVIDKIQGGEQ